MKHNERTDAHVLKTQDQAKEQRATEGAWGFSGWLAGAIAILFINHPQGSS